MRKSTTPIRKRQNRMAFPRSIWALGFVSLLMDLSSELIHSLLPVFLLSALGTSALVIGLIEGTAEAAALIVKVFSGMLSDYWGKRKPLAMLGYGLGALSKPLFVWATCSGAVFVARLVDRCGKGIRGAPRDALVADLAPQELRGAAFGLRQSLDTVGAFLGPLLALGLMLVWQNDFRRVFQVAVIPGVLAVMVLYFGVREGHKPGRAHRFNPLRREHLSRLPPPYWRLLILGAVFTLARFSEAFLVLRAEQGGLPIAFTPLVLIAMNVVYSLSAYPFGILSDRMNHARLLALGLLVLIVADSALAYSPHWTWVWSGIMLWGLHMGITQGLLARMIADTSPADLRGSAYGFFNLICGLALLVASVVAGMLWDRFGAPQTFVAGIVFSGLALGMLGFCADRKGPCSGESKRSAGRNSR